MFPHFLKSCFPTCFPMFPHPQKWGNKCDIKTQKNAKKRNHPTHSESPINKGNAAFSHHFLHPAFVIRLGLQKNGGEMGGNGWFGGWGGAWGNMLGVLLGLGEGENWGEIIPVCNLFCTLFVGDFVYLYLLGLVVIP